MQIAPKITDGHHNSFKNILEVVSCNHKTVIVNGQSTPFAKSQFSLIENKSLKNVLTIADKIHILIMRAVVFFRETTILPIRTTALHIVQLDFIALLNVETFSNGPLGRIIKIHLFTDGVGSIVIKVIIADSTSFVKE